VPEDRKERVDRELVELLNELRIALPGIQVLFAFLLTLPFTSRFDALDDGQRDVYFAAFLCTAAGSVLLMAPLANHRLRFRAFDKEQMVLRFNMLAIAGSVFLAAAIGLSVYLITDVLYESGVAGVVTGLTAGWTVFFWYAVPLWHRWRQDRPGP
jgi:Family of unknown function (DUF6328)